MKLVLWIIAGLLATLVALEMRVRTESTQEQAVAAPTPGNTAPVRISFPATGNPTPVKAQEPAVEITFQEAVVADRQIDTEEMARVLADGSDNASTSIGMGDYDNILYQRQIRLKELRAKPAGRLEDFKSKYVAFLEAENDFVLQSRRGKQVPLRLLQKLSTDGSQDMAGRWREMLQQLLSWVDAWDEAFRRACERERELSPSLPEVGLPSASLLASHQEAHELAMAAFRVATGWVETLTARKKAAARDSEPEDFR